MSLAKVLGCNAFAIFWILFLADVASLLLHCIGNEVLENFVKDIWP